MKLDEEIYERLARIDWFSRCGSQDTVFGFAVTFVNSRDEALRSIQSADWMDVRTEAQGDLTGYLAKHHYDSYGGHWNKLAKASRQRLEEVVAPRLRVALRDLGMDTIGDTVLLDLNRICLQAAYKKSFRKIPDFFERLSTVYESCQLPCGWDGGIKAWPKGCFFVY